MELHIWEAWIGQKIVKCQSDEDGRTYIELDDGRGAVFPNPETYTAKNGVNPLTVAETTL